MNVQFHHQEDTAQNVKTFWFKPEQLPRYEAGQFIELTLPHESPDDRGTKRWFTLSSSPTDKLLSITTKIANTPSTFKQTLLTLQPGDPVHMTDTMGDFVLPTDATAPLLFIAGGIGVTPVHSMLKYLHDSGQKRTTHLVYATHNPKELAFKELFDETASHIEYITDKQLSSATVLTAAQAYSKPYIYLSGPEEMVEVLVAELTEKGVNRTRLITDYFPGYAGIL